MFSRSIDSPVTDRDLHAFVDGELDGRRYRQVVQRLAVDPYAAERVSAILRQQGGFALLREHLADVEPADDEQAKAFARRLAGTVRHHRRVRLTSVASGLALSLAVGVLTLWGPDPSTVASRLPWPTRADDGPQVLFGRDPFGDGGTVLPAAGSGAIDTFGLDQQLAAYAVRRPDLAAHGLTFLRGDMLKSGGTPAVRLVYEDVTGEQVFLFIGAVGTDDDVALTLVPEGHVSLNWRRGPLVFALIGPKESKELLEVMRSTGDFLVPVPELQPGLPPAGSGNQAVIQPAEAAASVAPGTADLVTTTDEPATGPAGGTGATGGAAVQGTLPVAPALPVTPAGTTDTTPKAL